METAIPEAIGKMVFRAWLDVIGVANITVEQG
jgi:hypothetical protein